MFNFTMVFLIDLFADELCWSGVWTGERESESWAIGEGG